MTGLVRGADGVWNLVSRPGDGLVLITLPPKIGPGGLLYRRLRFGSGRLFVFHRHSHRNVLKIRSSSIDSTSSSSATWYSIDRACVVSLDGECQ